MATDPTEPQETLLVEELQEQVGGDLRAVASYRGENYDLTYLRDNVERLYTAEEIDGIFDDLVLQGLHKKSLESLFNAGHLECMLLRFENALMFHFISRNEDTSGLFVTIDIGTDVDIESITATCKKHL